MRLSEYKVAQLVEAEPPQIVLLDRADGAEIVLSMDEARRLRGALEYFAAHGFGA